MPSRKIYLYDTTLRDGEQAEGITFSLPDKKHICTVLDQFGIDYIEGGWPGANPKASEFFNQMKKVKLKHSKLTAFGSTRKKKIRPEEDKNLAALLEAGTPSIAIFGKSWDLHVKEALRTTFDENVKMIYDSVKYLKSKKREVIYDAEHFFDGYKNEPEYALKTVEAAADAGADCIVLCDTNGGTLPMEYKEILDALKDVIGDYPFGIHAHNDSGVAVANSLTAIKQGACHVQGTINGFGERCGNADLIQVIPALVLKMGLKCVSRNKLKDLKKLSHAINEIANLVPDDRQPYVGNTVFTHKGGIHVSAVLRNVNTYEHIEPEAVGNKRRVLVSEMSGLSNVRYKAEELGIDISTASDETKELLSTIKEMENEGYEFESAEGSFEVMLQKALGKHKKFFDLVGFRVIVEKRGPEEPCLSEATIKIKVGDELKHMAADGTGPVNALDNALRRALVESYPELQDIHLTDYKVRVINPKEATAAAVRVIIESSDGKKVWGTVGVSENIIQASWRALIDSIEYKLLKKKSNSGGKKKKSSGKKK